MARGDVSAEELVPVLHDLIETCKDREKSYRARAEEVADSGLKGLFHAYARQSAQFITELEREFECFGAEPRLGRHVAGTLFCRGTDIPFIALEEDNTGVLSKCEWSEATTVESYERALERTWPANSQSVIVRQYMELRDARDRLRILGNVARTSPSE